MKLYMLLRSNYLGNFEEEKVNSFGIGPSFVDFAAPIEWIRVESDDEPSVLSKLRALPEADITAHLPRRIKSKLQERLAEDPMSQRIYRALAFGSCLNDMSGPLANEVERLRNSGADSERQLRPPEDS